MPADCIRKKDSETSCPMTRFPRTLYCLRVLASAYAKIRLLLKRMTCRTSYRILTHPAHRAHACADETVFSSVIQSHLSWNLLTAPVQDWHRRDHWFCMAVSLIFYSARNLLYQCNTVFAYARTISWFNIAWQCTFHTILSSVVL